MSIHVILNAAKEAAKDATDAVILDPAIADGAMTARTKMISDTDLQIDRVMKSAGYYMSNMGHSEDDYHSVYRQRHWFSSPTWREFK